MTYQIETITRDSRKLPHWRRTALRADAWKSVLGALEFLFRQIRFGIRDIPSIPFTHGRKLLSIPQTEKDLLCASGKLSDELENKVFEELIEDYSQGCIRQGNLASSAFVVWVGEGVDEKGRFVLKVHIQSKYWPRDRVKMETIHSFAMEIERKDHLF